MSKKGSFHFHVSRAVKPCFVFLLALSLIFAGGVPGTRAEDNILYVKPVEPGTGNCSSWDTACTLQDALTNAVSGKQIWVAAGTYKPGLAGSARTVTFQLKKGVAIYGGFAGTETSLDHRNWTTNVVILSGDLKGDDSGFTNNVENSYHVLRGVTGATLDGVTIRGGNANSVDSDDRVGGGMYNSNSSPMLTNVTFSGNSADYGGGGIYNFGSSPILTNITFSGNMVPNVGGGGMSNENNSNPTLTNVIFSGNMTNVFGGGMNNNSSNPTLSNATFSGNWAQYGGGGMVNTMSSPTLSNVTFSGNSADSGNGGGMYNRYTSKPTLSNITFSSNAADWGGGMYNSSSFPTLSNVTFSGNTASQNGGGMVNGNSSPRLTNVTFSNNTAISGGGIYNVDSNPTVRNSIMWDDSGGEINNNNSTPTVSYSDVQGGYPGTGNIDADPLLAPLEYYGGRVRTMALLPGSPVIDAASTYCPTTDGRGLTRSSPNCDMGAFESQGFTLTKTGGDGQSTLVYTAFTEPLCVAMTANYAGEPLDGAKITFTPPTSGASATLTGSPVTISSEAACVIAVANDIGGIYKVSASTTGAVIVTFSLTNDTTMKTYLPMIRK